jgi:hypothetical protein
MTLPTKTNLETMDYSYGGVPFVSVATKAGIDLDTLDYSYAGVPFWAVMPSGEEPPPPTGLSKQFMYYARQRGNLC